MALLLGYLALATLAVLAMLAPLVIGRWLAERDRVLEDAEAAAIEERALAMLAGRPDPG